MMRFGVAPRAIRAGASPREHAALRGDERARPSAVGVSGGAFEVRGECDDRDVYENQLCYGKRVIDKTSNGGRGEASRARAGSGPETGSSDGAR